MKSKNIYRVISVVLLITMLMTMSACSNNDASSPVKEKSWYIGGKEEEFADIANTIDTESIYAKLNYNEKMLYGTYSLQNEKKDLSSFVKNTSKMDLEYFSRNQMKKGTAEVVSLPTRVAAGPTSVCSLMTGYRYGELRNNSEQNWAILRFAANEESSAEVICTYSVNGNTVSYYPVDYYLAEKDNDGNLINFEYTLGEKAYEYTFSFSGPYMTLSNGEDSVRLCSYSFSDNTSSRPSIIAYSELGSPLVAGIDEFSALTSLGMARKKDGDSLSGLSFKLDSDGRITIVWNETTDAGERTTHTEQFVYFIAGGGALSSQLILADEKNVYYYYDDPSSREMRLLNEDYDEKLVADLSDESLKEISEKKEDLFNELSAEFAAQGIDVSINRASGEIALDSSILFGGDSGVVTEEGKAFLNKFVAAYTSIVFSDKYKDFIKKTMVEGHTAPIAGSTYESGLPLSEERAENVKAYCISPNTGISDTYVTLLSDSLVSVGCSNSRPVYDANGQVDMAASRRVSFRFIVNISA